MIRMLRIDVHQHLWPEPLLAELSRRAEPPCLRRFGSDWMLHVAGEPPSRLDPAAVGIDRRLEQLAQDGTDRALVALSSVLGVEGLPEDEARPLLAAFAAGTAELPDAIDAWGSLALRSAAPADVE